MVGGAKDLRYSEARLFFLGPVAETPLPKAMVILLPAVLRTGGASDPRRVGVGKSNAAAREAGAAGSSKSKGSLRGSFFTEKDGEVNEEDEDEDEDEDEEVEGEGSKKFALDDVVTKLSLSRGSSSLAGAATTTAGVGATVTVTVGLLSLGSLEEDLEELFLWRWTLSTGSGELAPAAERFEPERLMEEEELFFRERGGEPKKAVARAEMDRALWGLMAGVALGSSILALTSTAATSCSTAIHWFMSSAVSDLSVRVSFCVMICQVFFMSFIWCGLALANTNEIAFFLLDEDEDVDEPDDEEEEEEEEEMVEREEEEWEAVRVEPEGGEREYSRTLDPCLRTK